MNVTWYYVKPNSFYIIVISQKMRGVTDEEEQCEWTTWIGLKNNRAERLQGYIL